MLDFHKQATFEAKLAELYTSLAPEVKAEVSQQDFILEFPIIEINGKAVMPDKPVNSTFELSDEDYTKVADAFKASYRLP